MYNIIKPDKRGMGDRKGKMKKNVIVLILLIVSVAGNILLYSRLKTSTTDNKNLNTTISEVQASMDNLENQISEVQADLSDTNTKNEELQSENESLQSEIESLQAEQIEKVKKLEQQETTKVEFTEERYQYFSKMMQEDPENKTGWQDDYSYDEVVEYITRDVMKDMPSGGSSGHIDAPAPEGSAPSNANEIGDGGIDFSGPRDPSGIGVVIQ